MNAVKRMWTESKSDDDDAVMAEKGGNGDMYGSRVTAEYLVSCQRSVYVTSAGNVWRRTIRRL